VGANLAAEVEGVDLARPLSDADRDTIHDGLAEHQLLIFRDQEITSDRLMEFGERFGDNANTVTLADYWIADGYAAWNGENYRVTARVTNLFDTDYVPWSDVFYLQQLDPGWPYANQLILGAPRTWELSLEYFF